ncbi:CBS domain-containing protein [bacterium]|nr:CBS domain-containing protein [bacterium]
MSTVRKVLEEKQDENIYSVAVDATVLEALRVMAEAETGAVLVSEGDRFVGIFTERDYARDGELKGHCAKDTRVRDVMTREMISVKPETTTQQCMEIMTEHRVRHLPVVSKARIIGIVSIGDVVKAVMDEADKTISSLQDYIQGTGYGR